MQLMTFNSLLMFDIVFIFFLFLVGITCLVYYLPPREISQHDATAQLLSTASSSFSSSASEGLLTRECASVTRQISDEDCPTPIILIGVGGEDKQQQQAPPVQESFPTGERQESPVLFTTDTRDPSSASLENLRDSRKLYPVRMVSDGARTIEGLFKHEHEDDHDVLLLDYGLDDILVLRQMAESEIRTPFILKTPRSSTIATIPLADRHYMTARRACHSCYCQYQSRANRWPLLDPPSSEQSIVYQSIDNSVQHPQHFQSEDDKKSRSEFVRIDIEHNNSFSSSRKHAVTGREPSLPACCYVRAKDIDSNACSGPIYDV